MRHSAALGCLLLYYFVLLDISAAFNLFDDCILKLNASDRSYLRAVSVGNISFCSATITFGGSPGLYYWPFIVFNLRDTSGSSNSQSNISFHCYADDTHTVNTLDLSSAFSLS